MGCLMGIDVGGSVAKAAIYNTSGREVCACGVKMDTLTPKPGFCERSMEQVRQSILDAIVGVMQKSGMGGGDIQAVGVTGQANGLYMLRSDGTAVYPAILSSDTRAKALIMQWNEDGTLDHILPMTRQILWAGQTAALVAWFSRHDRQTLEAADIFLTAKDYARYLLTGEFALECTETSSTSLMDISTGQISPHILGCLGISEYKGNFPARILRSEEVGGGVTAECAAHTGLLEGTPVVGGLIDTVASIISQGVVREEQMGMIVGTWGINAFITMRPLYAKDIFSAFYYCIPGYHLILEGSPTSATNLEWFIDTFLKQRGMVFHGYDDINARVEASAPYGSLLFLPFLYGSNVNLNAEACFVGLRGYHGIPDLLRAIYEGVAFCHRCHIERLLKLREMPSTVRMAGGGARSRIWMQIFADVLGMSVEVSEAEELGALGAAMAAGVGVGIFSDFEDAGNRFARIRQTYTPSLERHAYYTRKYAMYCRLIDAMDPLWDELVALEGE
ncbi:MAG: carbohydrate kinase [Clostridiales bacterium]|nr:carbohydrate kinase [Clostridiales bacterium]